MLLAISNDGKIGLGLVAGLLIAFAILSAFVFPRRNPDFPGNRLGLFVLVSVVLFAGTVAGVVFFAVEEEEPETHATETGGEPTTTAETTTTGTGEPAGDATAGEAVFASASCGGCHTLAAAGAAGAVGPNLDDAKLDLELVIDRVTNGRGAMPAFASQLDDEQIQDVAAYVVASTQR